MLNLFRLDRNTGTIGSNWIRLGDELLDLTLDVLSVVVSLPDTPLWRFNCFRGFVVWNVLVQPPGGSEANETGHDATDHPEPRHVGREFMEAGSGKVDPD